MTNNKTPEAKHTPLTREQIVKLGTEFASKRYNWGEDQFHAQVNGFLEGYNTSQSALHEKVKELEALLKRADIYLNDSIDDFAGNLKADIKEALKSKDNG